MGLRAHANAFEDLRNASVNGPTVLPSGGPEDELEVRFHAPVHQQLEILENDAQAAAQHRYVFCTDSPEIEPADGSFTREQAVFRRHRADDGSLSGAHLAYDVNKVARMDGHVQAVDDDVLPVEDVRP